MTLEQLNPRREILFYPKDLLPKSPLYVVGTIHRAPEKAPLLEKLLKEIAPAIITVEISPYSLRLRRKHGRYWLARFDKLRQERQLSEQNSALRLYREALKMPYELQVAEQIALQKNIPLVPVDSSRIARRLLRELVRGLSPQNLHTLALDPSIHLWEQEEALVRFLLRTGLWPRSTEEDRYREARMCRIIKLLAAQKKPLVHIGGWRHLPALLRGLPTAVGIFLSHSNVGGPL